MSCSHNKAMNCTCTYSCPKHGKCCDCVAYHLHNGEFPACFFSKEAEATYDRSLAALKQDREEK